MSFPPDDMMGGMGGPPPTDPMVEDPMMGGADPAMGAMAEEPPPKPEEEAIDPSQSEPDSAAAVKLVLTPEQELEIAESIVKSIDQHDSAYEKRWKKIDRIADSYEMEFDTLT